MAGLVATMLLVVTACAASDEPSVSKSSRASSEKSQLNFTKPDGSTFSLVATEVTCEPTESDQDTADRRVVSVHVASRRHSFLIEAVPGDVGHGKRFTLPIGEGIYDHPRNVILFYGDKEFEASTSQEEGAGTLDIRRASCDPAAIELDVDATLGSEYFDGKKLEVEGHLELGYR